MGSDILIGPTVREVEDRLALAKARTLYNFKKSVSRMTWRQRFFELRKLARSIPPILQEMPSVRNLLLKQIRKLVGREASVQEIAEDWGDILSEVRDKAIAETREKQILRQAKSGLRKYLQDE